LEITNCFEVKDVHVSPALLLLDPNNPRMSLNWGKPKLYSDKELCSDELQDKVFKEIHKPRYKLTQLILSIANKGFIPGTDRMIVRKLNTSEKFLVLEGNRRTAAIKYLSSRASELRKPVWESIQKIPTQVFSYIKNEIFSEEEVLEFLLATIQVEGKETWGPMENAFYIYRSYMRELRRQRKASKIIYDQEVAEHVGKVFNRKTSELRHILSTYNIFRQLREGGYEETSPEYYSLIELAVKTGATREHFFEFDSVRMLMSSVGLERFAELCLDPESPVRNPQDFAAFTYVYKNGTSHEVGQILKDRREPKLIKTKTRQRLQKRIFVEKLQEIKSELESLKPTDYKGTDEENILINDLYKIFTSKLIKLTK
jgi:hypothetical protein